jgi:hypothetical protein
MNTSLVEVLRRPVEFALAAMVGVMDQLVARLASPEGHDERGDDEVGGLPFAHRPAHDRVVVEIPDRSEVELAVLAGELGDVGHPSQIGALGAEVALQQVRRRDHLGVSALAPLLAAMDANQAVMGHQPCHSVARHADAAVAELALDPRRSVGAPRRLVDLADLHQQLRVRRCASRHGSGPPRVVARPGDPGDPTQVRDAVLGLVLVNEPKAGHRIVSFAK